MTKTKPKTDHIDRYIGRRLRTLREAHNISQEKLAELIDVSFQQVQKYEAGTNRIAGSRFYRASRVLEVTPDYFFMGLEGMKDDPAPLPAFDAESLRLLRGLERVPGTLTRDTLFRSLHALINTVNREEAAFPGK